MWIEPPKLFTAETLQVKKNRKETEEYFWDIKAPLAVSHYHLLVTPPSHFTPQKIRGYVGRFFMNEEKSTNRMVSGLRILSSGFLGSFAKFRGPTKRH